MSYCPGFPDHCRKPVSVPADPPHHFGGIACGCDREESRVDMADEALAPVQAVRHEETPVPAVRRMERTVPRARTESGRPGRGPVTGDHEEMLRLQVRDAVRNSDYTQANLARRLGLSGKHLSQMLTGSVRLGIPWAAGILDAVGMTLDIRVVRGPSERQRQVYDLTHRDEQRGYLVLKDGENLVDGLDRDARARHAAGECG